MLDGFVRPLIDPPFDHMARWLAARHVSADSLTWLGLAIGLAVVPTIVAERYLTGLLLILATRLLDGFDGAVARQTAPTDRGAYLDVVGDFLFYSAMVFAFALARPGNATAAAFLIFSFVGTGSSFLAFSAIAAKPSLTTTARGSKSL